jgi:hypothetical protein
MAKADVGQFQVYNLQRTPTLVFSATRARGWSKQSAATFRCTNCRREMYSHCQESFAWKFSGARPDGSTLLGKNGTPVYSAYFQQSSFSSHAIANERFVVKVNANARLRTDSA